MVRLVDLEPRWVGAGGEGIYQADGSPAPERHGVAISFRCPCGTHPRDDEYETDRCVIMLNNPLDGQGPLNSGSSYWTRTGDTFETLSLTPSIQRHGACNWHGFITNGEVTNA